MICPVCKDDLLGRTRCSSYCEGYRDAQNEAAAKDEARRAKPYWAARAICAILDEADEVIPDAECPLVMPPELWAWRFEHFYGKSRGVHVEDNVVSAVEQHICMQNDYRTSPFRRYVPDDQTFAAGYEAAVRAFWQGVCEQEARRLEGFACGWQAAAAKEARRGRVARSNDCRYEAKQRQSSAAYDYAKARELHLQAIQLREWASE